MLTSSPKRTSQLFPHAPSSDVKCHETEVLIVVHCGLPVSGDVDTAAKGDTAAPQVLAAAISAHIYTLPSKPPSSLVYISKVDSSGYAASAGPLTRALASGLLLHYLSPKTRIGGPSARVTATLFARSQGQYLFPNSVEGGGKRVLGGLGLCQWWKSVYEETARLCVGSGLSATQLELRYLLPSYSSSEAKGMLGAARQPLPSGLEWSYAPPFTKQQLGEGTSLATMIPSLPDDPKTRFLEELVADGEPTRSNGAPTSPSKAKTRKERDAADEEAERKRAHAALTKIPAEEFWERIGFRQECASGDVTGFFAIEATPQEADSAPTAITSSLPQATVARVLKSLLNTDFKTRALAAAGTEQWLASTKTLVVDEIGEDGWKACVASIAAKDTAPIAKRKEEPVVTMLQPRKKKRV